MSRTILTAFLMHTAVIWQTKKNCPHRRCKDVWTVLKALYLRLTELYKKWENRPVPNWAMVRNQLSIDAGMQSRIMKYEKY